MIRFITNIRNRFILTIHVAVLTIFSFVSVVTAGGLVEKKSLRKDRYKKYPGIKPSEVMTSVHEQRVKFVANQGVVDSAALVASVRHSKLANLLISLAIEESRGDPVAVGSSGERGAWQVKASDWGTVPKDIHGQAWQAERIISDLLIHTKGDKKKALAHYNGGTTPPGRSYRYAERILKRARHLYVAVNDLPPHYVKLRQALLDPPDNSRIVTAFYQAGIKSNRAAFYSS